MADTAEDLDYKLKLRRYEFIVACAYYIQLKGDNGDLDRLVMTTELAELITERYKTTDMHWAVAGFKYYEQLLDAGMNESLPDFNGKTVETSIVLDYNFRSLVAAEVRRKKLLYNFSKVPPNERPKLTTAKKANLMAVIKAAEASAAATRATPLPTTVTPPEITPIAIPHEFLKGFTVFVKPDVHLDETVPICARDQHLLYNIFGEKWTSPVVIGAYTTIKGETGFMNKWTNPQP